jgi:hypothetical protein
MIRSAVLTIVLFAALASPAASAGGPIVGAEASNGVTAPGLASRFATTRVQGGTLITKVERRGGGIIASHFVHRRLVVSAVALDGSGTGLAADGGTLVLAAPRSSPRRRSDFVVFDTQRLRAQATVSLRGDFTLDAISPDGNLLYLIESTSPDDLTRYAVRAYDVAKGRLRPGAIVDADEADEPMQGTPIARAMSHDGRWAFTLYDGEHPFIHALDTVAASAKCIDLDQLAGYGDLSALRLAVEPGGSIAVRRSDQARPLLTVDPRTYVAREPAIARPRTPAPTADGGISWLLIVGGVAAVGFVGAITLGRPNRGLTPRRAP